MVGQAWVIGKRRLSRDWGRKIWMFDRLIWTVMGFGADIWEGKGKNRQNGGEVFEMGCWGWMEERQGI